MNQLQYDKRTSKTVSGEKIDYGIVYGNEKIVFIKRGAGNNIRGHQDKYLKLAHRIHQRLGATVICASNPWVKHELQCAADKAVIAKIAAECGFVKYSLSLVGISDGAYYNFILAKETPETISLLGINTSPKLCAGKSDLHDLENRLQPLASIHKTLVYGTEDEEYCHVPYLKALDCDNLEIRTVEGADHDFTGMVEAFIALSDLL